MIVSTNTTVTIDNTTGVQLFSNKDFSVKVNSDGVVFDSQTDKVIPPTKCGRYFVSFKGEKHILTRLPTLIARVLSGKHVSMREGEKVYVLDKSKPFTPDNIEISHTKPQGYVKTAKVYKAKQKPLPTAAALVVKVVNPPITMVEIAEYKGKSYYMTEDFTKFENETEANAHQIKVSKGKNLAEIVLSSKGGYVLAERMFEQEVTYLGKKPYPNFVDMMENNKGVQSVYEESTYSVELQTESKVVAELCDKLDRKPKMTKEEATRIKHLIEVVAEAELTLTKIVKS